VEGLLRSKKSGKGKGGRRPGRKGGDRESIAAAKELYWGKKAKKNKGKGRKTDSAESGQKKKLPYNVGGPRENS